MTKSCKGDAWKAKYIRRWIPTGAPFSGTPLALKALLSGENLGIPDQDMPIPVGPGGEVEYSREDIRNLAANGANIYAGEPEGGPKSGPGK